MSHYDKRLEQDVDEIRDGVRTVGERVRKALAASVRALLTSDRDLASRTILGDLPINREIRALDHRCHAFVARHFPGAGHLRFVSSVLRCNVALERVGDYAVTIGREAVQLRTPPSGQVARDIELMADHAGRMLRQAVAAFVENDAEHARETRQLEDQAERSFHRVFMDLVQEGEAGRRSLAELFAELTVFNALERVTDQSKNLCEETMFSVMGETKPPKTYHVLFVDETNDGLSQLAEIFARKAYPKSGRFASGGWAPAEDLDPDCRQFLERNGYDLAGASPKHMPTRYDELSEFHVIVSLGGDVRSLLDEVPFRTVILEWELEGQDLEGRYKDLSLQIRELMETMRGPDAD